MQPKHVLRYRVLVQLMGRLTARQVLAHLSAQTRLAAALASAGSGSSSSSRLELVHVEGARDVETTSKCISNANIAFHLLFLSTKRRKNLINANESVVSSSSSDLQITISNESASKDASRASRNDDTKATKTTRTTTTKTTNWSVFG